MYFIKRLPYEHFFLRALCLKVCGPCCVTTPQHYTEDSRNTCASSIHLTLLKLWAPKTQPRKTILPLFSALERHVGGTEIQ